MAQHRPASEIQMSTTKPEVEITFEQNRWRSNSNGNPTFSTMPNFDMALRTRRHRPTSETQMSATKPEVETGNGNNF